MASDQMRYGMLGDDDSTPEEKLAKYAGITGWDYLKEHYANGVLFFVDESLSLTEVGAALSADESDRVQAWLKSADLVKIEELHAQQWKDGEQEFEALVVSPFVLCRPVS